MEYMIKKHGIPLVSVFVCIYGLLYSALGNN